MGTKLIIAGSDKLKDYEILKKYFILANFKDVSEIITFESSGFGELVSRLARDYKIRFTSHDASFCTNNYENKKTLYERNKIMTDSGTGCIVLWYKRTKLINNTINLMRAKNARVYVKVLNSPAKQKLKDKTV